MGSICWPVGLTKFLRPTARILAILLLCVLLCLVRVFFSKGDMAGAEEIIQKMENIARECHVPPWITNQMTAWQARIWLAQGNLEAASQWALDRGLYVNGELTVLHEMEYIVLARILIAQGRLAEANALLQRLLETAETGGRTSRVIEILMLQALAFHAFHRNQFLLQDPAEAFEYLGTLLIAGAATNSYDRYTYYRLLSQLGTDSACASGR